MSDTISYLTINKHK